ncbi:DELLA protein GAI [Linum grandiflorum]
MDAHAASTPPLKKRSWQEIFFQPTNQHPTTIQPSPLTSTTFHLLNHRGYNRSGISAAAASAGPQKPLSIEEVITLAATRIFRCSNSGQVGIPSLLNIPFDSSISGLSVDEQKNVELAEYLLSSADKVGNRQYDDASGWIDLCECLSSPTGNPVQRIVHYFARALGEKIERETGRNYPSSDETTSLANVLRLPSPSMLLTVHERFPYYRMQQVASVQAMTESAAKAKRIHGIDLQIKSGLHWIGLMQAVESRTDHPIEFFRITALCTGPVEPVRTTGDRLSDFARSKGIKFDFRIVIVGDVLDLKYSMFEVDENKEAVMVYSEYSFANMISQPDRMDTFMRVMRRLNPRIVVVTEKEGNHNSRHFPTRFVETLFNYGAVFDSVDACMAGEDDEECRTYLESGIMGRMISNIVAREGDERVIRGVPVDMWRAFFGRFGMVEKKLSSVVWEQVRSVKETAENGEFCTVGKDGKAMIIGWKGTPLFSVSIWKFFRSGRLVSGCKHLRVEFE